MKHKKKQERKHTLEKRGHRFIKERLIFFFAFTFCLPGLIIFREGRFTADALLSPYFTVRVMKVPLLQDCREKEVTINKTIHAKIPVLFIVLRVFTTQLRYKYTEYHAV